MPLLGERKESYKSFVEKVDSDNAECVIDFLNLIFGTGIENDLFWDEILDKQIFYDFNYKLNSFKKTDLTLGGLLYAIIHHCNINLKFDKTIQLGKNPSPFKKDNYMGFKVSSEVLCLRNIDIKHLSEKYREYRESNNYELAIKACNIKLSIEKACSYKSEYGGDPTLLADLGEILLETGEIDKAIEKAQNALKEVIYMMIKQ